ncbi:hypothetical protein C5C00_01580 [Rathayibacter rathayi]|uniref:HamA C-terminal domain-containing protein n=1 Tax=Rathayibacter rathayi TaxID=33887 RepID=UPI000CE8A342|nr:DUF1837 domain-containing protein [Rathayibacter rathayi]PPG90693.1 hypothetical protein C5C47_00850 [Rathayibacter rathayi]PPG98740.1 hypothetical protein C5C00_01580 [Rathayibacter rathayi]
MRDMMNSPLLGPSFSKGSEFLDIFYDEVEVKIGAKASIGLYVLRIDAGELSVNQMYEKLHNASFGYVFSRQTQEQVTPDNFMEISAKVHSRFRFPEKNSGEGGEMLLYAFLEGHLGAPKLLTKMELKTAGNDYVKGSDGIHLLDLGDSKYHLIFGESKMYGDTAGKSGLHSAIYAAFESMAKVRDGFYEFDTWLVDSGLLKEAADEQTLAALKELLIPSAKGSVKKDNAFGVFFGYEVDATEWDRLEMDALAIERKIQDSAHEVVASQVEYVRTRMREKGLEGAHFYVYAVPFLKTTRNSKPYGIEEVRIELAEKLSGQKYVEKPVKKVPK